MAGVEAICIRTKSTSPFPIKSLTRRILPPYLHQAIALERQDLPTVSTMDDATPRMPTGKIATYLSRSIHAFQGEVIV